MKDVRRLKEKRGGEERREGKRRRGRGRGSPNVRKKEEREQAASDFERGDDKDVV